MAASDPSNAVWQRDLMVVYLALALVGGEDGNYQKALSIAEAMLENGTLAPKDAWIIDELKRRTGSN